MFLVIKDQAKLICQRLRKKIKKIKIIESQKINDQIISKLNDLDCLIIDNFNNDINEKLLYSIINQSKQLENYLVINSLEPIKKTSFNLKDLQSRVNSLIDIESSFLQMIC